MRIWGIRLNDYVRVNEFGKDLFYNHRFGGTTLARQHNPYGLDNGAMFLSRRLQRRYQEYLDRLPRRSAKRNSSNFSVTPRLWMARGFQGSDNATAFEGRNIRLIIGRASRQQRPRANIAGGTIPAR